MIGKDSGWSHVIITVGMCRLVWEVCFVQFSYETQMAYDCSSLQNLW